MSVVSAGTEGRKPLTVAQIYKDHTVTTSIANAIDAKTLRTLRRRIEQPGYSREQANYGISWACEWGFEGTEWGYRIAMSRIFYSDDELANGVRFDGWAA